MGFLRHQSLSSFWGKAWCTHLLPTLSSHLKELSVRCLIPVSPLIHPPGLISASALEMMRPSRLPLGPEDHCLEEYGESGSREG